MNRFFLNFLLILIIALTFPIFAPAKATDHRQTQRVRKHLENWENPLKEWNNVGKIKIDSVSALPEKKTIQLFFSTPLSYIPVREENSRLLQKSLKDALGRKFKPWYIEIYTDHHLLQELIPNSLRSSLPLDTTRMPPVNKQERISLVRRISAEIPNEGLYNNNIALWSSHGWYYESKLDRWEWQRARLFGTVEDIFTKSMTLPYLVPMLENSGATVLMPVERDWQPKEVIVDYDRSSAGSRLVIPKGIEFSAEKPGFLLKDTLISGENPFEMGTSLTFKTIPGENRQVFAYPYMEEGEYGVYISWLSFYNSSQNVKVTVNNLQGKHEFLVNQRMGGGTWVYLGTFPFRNSSELAPDAQYVAVSLDGKPGEVISLDAVRLGGGMGNIARRPAQTVVQNVKSIDDTQGKRVETATAPDQFSLKTSGKSRYREGARYYLQYAGFPNTLVYNLNEGKNDYMDDYQSRGEWVNYLTGNPNGPVKDRKVKGLQIPVDLSFAFHTDAGITAEDSIIGTLAIYSTWADSGKFPNGSSRMASRDLADLIQTQIVEDNRAQFNPEWTRRGLWDKQYSESWRPNVPAMLLELMSHQNLADMRFGLDPRFQFAVARSIYKGMLKFQAYQEHRSYVVQPLPVGHFALALRGDSAVILTWKPVSDRLEPSAIPVKYRVYIQINGNGFDEGVLVRDTTLVVSIKHPDSVYDFKVTAINTGGESFPSETLSVGLTSQPKGTVLVVNAFDRICGPTFIDTGTLAGIEEWNDQGVPWYYNVGYTGSQYDFNRKSEWTDDDNPGWGSSYGDMENQRIPGNSFDFTGIHGRAILNAGYNYVSVSNSVFVSAGFDPSRFSAVDVILGEEKATPSLKGMEQKARPNFGQAKSNERRAKSKEQTTNESDSWQRSTIAKTVDSESEFDFRIYTPAFMKKLDEIINSGGNILLSGAYVGSDFAVCNDTLAAKFAKEKLHFILRTGHAARTGNFYSTDYGKKWFHISGNFNAGYMPGIYTVEAPDGIEPAGENAFTVLRYRENNVSAGVAYRGKFREVLLGFPLETVTNTAVLEEMMKQIMGFFGEK